ncbi:MAG: hypothetical protein ABI811_23095 [Acidobacteriota bacterium]
MAFLSDTIGIVGLVLQVLALILISRGPISRYFPLFLYLLTFTGSSAAEGWILRTFGSRSPEYFNMYWGGELLLDLLLFFLVISLTVRALEDSPLRPGIFKFLMVVLFATLTLPFVLFEGPFFAKQWNQSVTQLLNFGAAIMNLGLWTSLLMSKRRDPQLLTVSAGLGLAVAGSALTFGLRKFTWHDSDVLFVVSNFAHYFTQIGSLLIWCKAFWPARTRVQPIITASAS